MQFTVLQLNVWSFEYFDNIVEFIKSNNVDIIIMQEAATDNKRKTYGINLLDLFKEKVKMDYVFAPIHTISYPDSKTISIGNAIFSKFPFIYSEYSYDKYLGNITHTNSDSPLHDTSLPKYVQYKYNMKQTTTFLRSIITVNNYSVRFITTHFSVSHKCTETLQMFHQAEQVVDIYKHSNNIPTIFAGDLNIHDKSASITLLKENFHLVQDGELQNTLSAIHPAITNDAPNGMRIDYTFYNNMLKLISSKTSQVVISDHLPTISVFELS